MKLSDEQILSGLKEGDERTSQYVYDEFFSLCQYIVNTNGGNSEDARDIFQESLIVLIKKVSEKEFCLTSKFQTFLFAIMNNLWKLELSKRKQAVNYIRKHSISVPTLEEFIEEYDQKLMSSMLWNCFLKLGKTCQTILKLWWKGLPQKEIANIMSFKYGYLRKKKMTCDDSLVCIIKEDSNLMKVFREDPELLSQVSCI